MKAALLIGLCFLGCAHEPDQAASPARVTGRTQIDGARLAALVKVVAAVTNGYRSARPSTEAARRLTNCLSQAEAFDAVVVDADAETVRIDLMPNRLCNAELGAGFVGGGGAYWVNLESMEIVRRAFSE